MAGSTQPIHMWPDFPKGLRVLLLDGELKSRQTAEMLLKSCCYTVTCCANCAEAVAFLKNPANVFDVLLADLRVISQKTADNVRLLEATQDLPSLLMSESATPEEVLQGIKLGAVDFLEKPLSPLKLRNIWQHVVRKQMKSRVEPLDAAKLLPTTIDVSSPAASDAAITDCSGSCVAVEPKVMDAEANSSAPAGTEAQDFSKAGAAAAAAAIGEAAGAAAAVQHQQQQQQASRAVVGAQTTSPAVSAAAPPASTANSITTHKPSSVVGLPVGWMPSPVLAVRPPCFMPPFMMGGPPVMWPVPPFMARPPVMPPMNMQPAGVMPAFSPVPVPGYMPQAASCMAYQVPTAARPMTPAPAQQPSKSASNSAATQPAAAQTSTLTQSAASPTETATGLAASASNASLTSGTTASQAPSAAAPASMTTAMSVPATMSMAMFSTSPAVPSAPEPAAPSTTTATSTAMTAAATTAATPSCQSTLTAAPSSTMLIDQQAGPSSRSMQVTTPMSIPSPQPPPLNSTTAPLHSDPHATQDSFSSRLPGFDSHDHLNLPSAMVDALDLALSPPHIKHSESLSSIAMDDDPCTSLQMADCPSAAALLDDSTSRSFIAPLGLSLKKSDSLVNFINECLHSSISSAS